MPRLRYSTPTPIYRGKPQLRAGKSKFVTLAEIKLVGAKSHIRGEPSPSYIPQ